MTDGVLAPFCMLVFNRCVSNLCVPASFSLQESSASLFRSQACKMSRRGRQTPHDWASSSLPPVKVEWVWLPQRTVPWFVSSGTEQDAFSLNELNSSNIISWKGLYSIAENQRVETHSSARHVLFNCEVNPAWHGSVLWHARSREKHERSFHMPSYCIKQAASARSQNNAPRFSHWRKRGS
jgi:hypothetical protein